MPEEIKAIAFRDEKGYGLIVDGKRVVPDMIDRYLYAFLEGVCNSENCYSCPYAERGRTSDLTLGDSWGTEYETEFKKGVSLALCQTEKGKELLAMARLELLDVDVERAIRHNGPLQRPTQKPSVREKFYALLERGCGFNAAVKKCYAKMFFKMELRALLVKLRLLPR